MKRSKIRVEKSNFKVSVFDSIFLEKSWDWLQNQNLRELINSPVITKQEQMLWFSYLNKRDDYLIWGVSINDEAIGAFGLKNLVSKKSAEYWGYIGEKKYWGLGIGKLMMSEAIQIADKMRLDFLTLQVNKNNHRAVKLYEGFNFIVTQVNLETIIMKRKIH